MSDVSDAALVAAATGRTSTSVPASKTPSASVARCQIGFDPSFEMSLKMAEDKKYVDFQKSSSPEATH